MTRMQVEWRAADENARHNLAMEQETVRHNMATEDLSAESNALQRQANDEIVRSHRTSEALTAQQLNETIRHQIAQDTETARSHRVSEAEISKHNRASEEISRAANDVKLISTKMSADATRYAADTSATASKYASNVNRAIANSKLAWQKEMDAAYLALKQTETAKLMQLNEAKIQQINAQIQQQWAEIAQENKRLDLEQQKVNVAVYNAKTQRGKAIVDALQRQMQARREKQAQRWKTISDLSHIIIDAVALT